MIKSFPNFVLLKFGLSLGTCLISQTATFAADGQYVQQTIGKTTVFIIKDGQKPIILSLESSMPLTSDIIYQILSNGTQGRFPVKITPYSAEEYYQYIHTGQNRALVDTVYVMLPNSWLGKNENENQVIKEGIIQINNPAILDVPSENLIQVIRENFVPNTQTNNASASNKSSLLGGNASSKNIFTDNSTLGASKPTRTYEEEDSEIYSDDDINLTVKTVGKKDYESLPSNQEENLEDEEVLLVNLDDVKSSSRFLSLEGEVSHTVGGEDHTQTSPTAKVYAGLNEKTLAIRPSIFRVKGVTDEEEVALLPIDLNEVKSSSEVLLTKEIEENDPIETIVGAEEHTEFQPSVIHPAGYHDRGLAHPLVVLEASGTSNDSEVLVAYNPLKSIESSSNVIAIESETIPSSLGGDEHAEYAQGIEQYPGYHDRGLKHPTPTLSASGTTNDHEPIVAFNPLKSIETSSNVMAIEPVAPSSSVGGEEHSNSPQSIEQYPGYHDRGLKHPTPTLSASGTTNDHEPIIAFNPLKNVESTSTIISWEPQSIPSTLGGSEHEASSTREEETPGNRSTYGKNKEGPKIGMITPPPTYDYRTDELTDSDEYEEENAYYSTIQGDQDQSVDDTEHDQKITIASQPEEPAIPVNTLEDVHVNSNVVTTRDSDGIVPTHPRVPNNKGVRGYSINLSSDETTLKISGGLSQKEAHKIEKRLELAKSLKESQTKAGSNEKVSQGGVGEANTKKTSKDSSRIALNDKNLKGQPSASKGTSIALSDTENVTKKTTLQESQIINGPPAPIEMSKPQSTSNTTTTSTTTSTSTTTPPLPLVPTDTNPPASSTTTTESTTSTTPTTTVTPPVITPVSPIAPTSPIVNPTTQQPVPSSQPVNVVAPDVTPNGSQNATETTTTAQTTQTAVRTNGPTQDVLINFNNVSVIEYIGFISKLTGKNFVFDEADLNFNVTIVSNEPTSLSNVMQALLQALRVQGLSLMEVGNNIIIHRNKKVNAPTEVVTGDQKSNAELVTRVFRLSNTDPDKMADIIRPMLSDLAVISPIASSGHLIVTDLTANVNKIADLIDSLDSSKSGFQIGRYVVVNTSLESVISLASRIMEPLAQGKTLTFTPDPTTNSVFVVSTPYLLQRAISVLQQVDVQSGSNQILSERPTPDIRQTGEPLTGSQIIPSQAQGVEIPDTTVRLSDGSTQTLTGGTRLDNGTIRFRNNFSLSPDGTLSQNGQENRVVEVLGGRNVATNAPPKVGRAEPIIFKIFKLRHRKGDQLAVSFQKIAQSLISTGQLTTNMQYANLLTALNSVQWVEATNSLVFSGTPRVLEDISELVEKLDVQVRQVLIEMLILDTSIADSLTYSVEWDSNFSRHDSAGATSFLSSASSPLNLALSKPNNINPLPGQGGQIINVQNLDAVGLSGQAGFSLGVIGRNLIRGNFVFPTIGALLTALHTDSDTNVIMNPKIVVEENNSAEIFVGENIRFRTQAITNDQGVIITENFEYRDIGSKLKVTPYISNDDIITLEIEQELSSTETTAAQSLGGGGSSGGTVNVNSVVTDPGPNTRKATTTTKVHMPDRYFLILSGMITDTTTLARAQVPCLGGLPVLGAAFSQKRFDDNKRNVMIFIRPQIVENDEIHRATKRQQDLYIEKTRVLDREDLEIDEALEFFNLKHICDPNRWADYNWSP